MQRLKRTWVEIYLDNLEHNYRQMKSLMRPETRMMAVVKADAYGHGAKQVSLTLQDAGVDWFGVSNIVEARVLRASGVTRPILILGYTPTENARDIFELACTQCVFGEDYARELSDAARRENVTLDVHIKVDTGMNRLGFSTGTEDFAAKIAQVCYLDNLKVTGVFTHFAVADDNSEQGRYYTVMQHRRFATVMEDLTNRGFAFRDVHCCNSAGAIFYPEYHHSMIRPGISLYGCSPNGRRLENVSLKPVMALKSVVASVKTIKAGERISYGGTYEAYSDMKVATIPIGYADGYDRSLSNRGYAYVAETVVPIVGRVCMDMTVIDVSAADAKEGDVVTLFGDGCPIEIENVAGIDNTIAYEVMCGISRRVQRVYMRGGEVVEAVDYTV